MSYTNTGYQPIKSARSQRGPVRGEPTFETYGEGSDCNWHAGWKDQRRQRIEVPRRKLMTALSR